MEERESYVAHVMQNYRERFGVDEMKIDIEKPKACARALLAESFVLTRLRLQALWRAGTVDASINGSISDMS